MSWEAVSAISSAVTAAVILLTVVYAARQVGAMNEQSRALGAQLEHLRRATQLDGTLAIFDELFSPELLAAYRFVMNDFETRMQDEEFHAEALRYAPDPETHKYVPLMRHMERIGTLIKNGLLDGDVLFDFASSFIMANWNQLRPFVLEQRRVFGEPRLWENFEFIAGEAQRFEDARGPSPAEVGGAT
jgi:hypothetical protein